jgi:hypothetical protein
VSQEHAIRFLSGTKLDEQTIRAEIDRGHLDGEPDRKFGRAASGGQVRPDAIDAQPPAPRRLWPP